MKSIPITVLLVALCAAPAWGVVFNGIMTAHSNSVTGGTHDSRKVAACKSARQNARVRHTKDSPEYKRCKASNARARAAGAQPNQLAACEEVHLLGADEVIRFASECSCYHFTQTFSQSDETRAATYCAVVYGFARKERAKPLSGPCGGDPAITSRSGYVCP